MKSPEVCNRVILAGAQGCRVLYCEACNVAEVEIGALSLRLEMQAFNSLGDMMQEAMDRLAVMRASEKEYQVYQGVRKTH